MERYAEFENITTAPITLLTKWAIWVMQSFLYFISEKPMISADIAILYSVTFYINKAETKPINADSIAIDQ